MSVPTIRIVDIIIVTNQTGKTLAALCTPEAARAVGTDLAVPRGSEAARRTEVSARRLAGRAPSSGPRSTGLQESAVAPVRRAAGLGPPRAVRGQVRGPRPRVPSCGVGAGRAENREN